MQAAPQRERRNTDIDKIVDQGGQSITHYESKWLASNSSGFEMFSSNFIGSQHLNQNTSEPDIPVNEV